MPIYFNLISLGCPKNQVDSEVMFTNLKRRGIRFTPDIEKSDACVINTCGFVEAARKESIETIMDVVRQKMEGGPRYIAVTGCLVNNNLARLKKEIPEVDIFLPSFDEDRIAEELLKKAGRPHREKACVKSAIKPFEREHFNLKSTAYLKISEGCDRTCSFCAIPGIRGKYLSRRIEEIIKEAGYLSGAGVKELILVSQDTSYYGTDLNMKNGLYRLLKELVKIKDIKWIRLMYLYPLKSLFSDDLLSLVNNEEKILKYLDIPIQHISDNVLKAMKRGSSRKNIINLIERLRNNIKDVSLRTSLIAGFPGETEGDFNELLSFVRDAEFDHLGVFKYSDEKASPSHRLGGKVKFSVKNERYKELMLAQAGVLGKIFLKRKEKKYNVIVDRISGGYITARGYFQAPDVDGYIFIPATDLKTRRSLFPTEAFVPVKIIKQKGYDLIGSLDGTWYEHTYHPVSILTYLLPRINNLSGQATQPRYPAPLKHLP